MISATSAVAGACAVGLSAVSQTWAFYTLYVPGRMVFASPLELATSTAISNWFIRRRSFALALLGVTQGTGLALMPFIAQQLITGWGWRSAWTLLGLFTMATGIIPAVLLMACRPEDMSLEPDPSHTRSRQPEVVTPQRLPDGRRMSDVHPGPERQFTLSQALQTRAFWILAVFSATGFLVQAGVSLHQEVSCRLIRSIDLVFELLLVVVTLLFPVRLLCRGLRKIRNFLGANSVVGKSLAPSRFTYNTVLNTL
jgi:MFS transporter, OFA family, oxalate/formate antiporter